MNEQEMYEIKEKVNIVEALLSQSNTIQKLILSSILSGLFIMAVFVYNITSTNSNEHKAIEIMITKEINYTHGIYENIIIPTETRSLSNKERLDKGGL